MTTTSIVCPYVKQITQLVEKHGKNLERYQGFIRLYPSYHGDPRVYSMGGDEIVCIEIVTVNLLKVERVAVFEKLSQGAELKPRVRPSDVASCNHAVLLSMLTEKEQTQSGYKHSITYLEAKILILDRAIFALTGIRYFCDPL